MGDYVLTAFIALIVGGVIGFVVAAVLTANK